MSNKKKIARKDAPKELIAQVQEVIAMADKNRYSVSRIFAAHNAVFGLNDTPQSCTSCLTTRTAALRTWYGDTGKVNNPKTGGNPVQVTGDKDPVAGPAAWTEARTATMGINEGSTDAERLTALQSIGADEFPSEDHAQFVAGEITEYEARVAAQDPNAPQFDAPAEGVTRYPMPEDGIPLDFTPSANNALKGTILHADGSNVKAGTYTAADGTTIAVSVGNKATIKDDLL